MRYVNAVLVLMIVTGYALSVHIVTRVEVVEGFAPRIYATAQSLVTVPAGSHIELASEGWFAVELSSSKGNQAVTAEEVSPPITQEGGKYYQASIDCPPTDRCLISGRAGRYYAKVTSTGEESIEVRVDLTQAQKRLAALVLAMVWLGVGCVILMAVNYD